MNISEKSRHFFAQASDWVAGNSVDILLALAAGALIALLLFALRTFGHRLVSDRSADRHWQSLIGRVLARTSSFFIIMCAAELVAEHAETPPAILRVVNILFVVSAALQAAVWGRELILGLIRHRVGEEEGPSTLGSAMGIIRLFVSVALFAIALIVILDNLGVNVTGLVAGLGIGGIAIGLAAQGIFKDLFAALSIIFDKPFRKGDGIRFENISGSVEQIGLKTTRLRSLEGEEVVISNAMLLDKQVHNFSNLEHRRLVLRFGLIYQTAPEVLAGVPEIVRSIVEAHRETMMRPMRNHRLGRLERRFRTPVRRPFDRLRICLRDPQRDLHRIAEDVRRARDRLRLSLADHLHRRAGRHPGDALSGAEGVCGEREGDLGGLGHLHRGDHLAPIIDGDRFEIFGLHRRSQHFDHLAALDPDLDHSEPAAAHEMLGVPAVAVGDLEYGVHVLGGGDREVGRVAASARAGLGKGSVFAWDELGSALIDFDHGAAVVARKRHPTALADERKGSGFATPDVGQELRHAARFVGFNGDVIKHEMIALAG